MALFAIIRPDSAINNDALGIAIGKSYPGNFYKLGKGQWLIVADETTKSLSDILGIKVGKHFGSTLVVEVGDYFGLHNKKLWEWIKARQPDE